MEFEPVPYSKVDWQRLDAFPDRTVFQIKPWLDFVSATQNAKPVVARLAHRGDVCGYFTGLVTRRFGAAILGSPFRGWTTSYMGFNLAPGVNGEAALEALERFAFRQLGCVHVELMDRCITPAAALACGYKVNTFSGFEVDLRRSEEEIFAAFSATTRNYARKALQNGLYVDESLDEHFADQYYEQLRSAFSKHDLVPTFGIERVRALIHHVFPSGQLLLLRVRTQTGECIATGIFPAFNDMMYFWGGASARAHQHLRPNELLQWAAIRYWKARGVGKYDMGGGGSYKRKFGGSPIQVPWIHKSKYPIVGWCRDRARTAFRLAQLASARRLGANRG
jgi:hypothetical protein